MRRLLHGLLPGMAAGAMLWLLGGCGWMHPHKSRSYDRSIDDEDRDPTYRADPQRADEEVHEAQ